MKKYYIATACVCLAALLICSFVFNFWNRKPEDAVLKVGFVYTEDESTPYTYNFIQSQHALEDAFGDNSKWKMSFIEIRGRAAVVAKNMLDWKEACKVYFDSRLPNYDTTIYYIRHLRKVLSQIAVQYRDKYELSSRRLDDMKSAIRFVLAERRICILIGNKEDAEKLKSNAQVWKDKLDADKKSGVAK